MAATADASPRVLRVAVVGGGVSGLGAAYALSQSVDPRIELTIYEAGPRLGGHANTVDVRQGGAATGSG